MGRQEELNRLIAQIRKQIPELNGVMIASTDGLSVAYDFPDTEAQQVAALAATAYGLGARVTEGAHLGELYEAVFRGSQGYLCVYEAGESMLVLSAPTSANLGLMRIEATARAAQIAEVFS